MKRRFFATLLGATLLFTSACKSKSDDKEAIRAGVVKHLTSLNMLNLSNMDINVTKAAVNGNQAQAQVEIRSKGGDPNAPPMQIGYTLERHGEEWVVLKSTGMGGGMQHPGPGEPPPGNTSRTMPPGHPDVSTGTGQRPSDHPDFNAILNGAQGSSQSAQPQTPAPGAKP